VTDKLSDVKLLTNTVDGHQVTEESSFTCGLQIAGGLSLHPESAEFKFNQGLKQPRMPKH